ncbi:SMP-30/gluconolactonase/LRE family protein [Fibrella aquatica]|uniref:SMP-30/gluconolactonase/LRE family protein n=1 Tax=Fibrella aquatica TaxID=3242487 RepID=UPI003521E3FB
MRNLLFLLGIMVCGQTVRAQTDPKLIEVADFGRYQPIGLAVSQDAPGGRIFVTFPKREPYQYGLAEIVNGQRKPYPDVEWNQWDSLHVRDRFVNVQALFVDQTNSLWVLDPANPAGYPPFVDGIKLVKINLKRNEVERVYRFDDLPRDQIGLNDVQVDSRRQVAYLSDPRRSAIVVLDLATGKSRTVLQKHVSTSADPNFRLVIDNKEVIDKSGRPFSSNVNGIALTHDFRYLYYRAINQTKLYRIDTELLQNPNLAPDQVAAGVEMMGETGVSHGMIADRSGNVYLTDSPNKAIRRFTPARKLETVVQDDRLLWPDSFGIGPDGYLYVTAAQIQRTPTYNNGQDKVQYPFRLFKVKL